MYDECAPCTAGTEAGRGVEDALHAYSPLAATRYAPPSASRSTAATSEAGRIEERNVASREKKAIWGRQHLVRRRRRVSQVTVPTSLAIRSGAGCGGDRYRISKYEFRIGS
jgi:hypothetical protein